MNRYIIFASALTLACSACEMKDELLSKDHDKDKGTLALEVMANAPSAMSRAEVSTSDFEVEIVGTGDLAEIKYTYETVSAMPSKISMPVGSYTITAHTAGELARQMDAPYYIGTADVEIEADLTTNKEVACTMANSRISVKYSEEFLSIFATWTITINDGTDQAICYTEDNLNPADLYWYFKNETKNITVDVRATTKKGNNIEASATYNKQNSIEGYANIDNEYFTGGDAIAINFVPVESGTTTGSISGITTEASISFDEDEETVELHLKDISGNSDPGNNDPVTPSDPIVITEPYGTNYLQTGVEYQQYYTEVDDAGIPYYLNYPEDVALHFEMPNGLKALYVLISGSEDFEFMTGLMGLTTEPYGLDLTDSTDENTVEIASMDLFTMPVAGATSYDFAFSEGIWRLLPGFVGKQSFKLRAVDTLGNVKESTLVVTIIEMD